MSKFFKAFFFKDWKQFQRSDAFVALVAIGVWFVLCILLILFLYPILLLVFPGVALIALFIIRGIERYKSLSVLVILIPLLLCLENKDADADECVTAADTTELVQLLQYTGGCINLVSGATYQFTEPVHFYLPTQLHGNGARIAADGWTRIGREHADAALFSTNRGGIAKIDNLTLDGSNLASYGIGPKNYELMNVTIRNTACSGTALAGPGIRIENSLFEHNGWNCLPYSLLPLGAAIYGQNQGTTNCFAAYILNNVMRDTNGPAIDLNNAWCGVIDGNFIYDNHGWAGISLYGASFWTINNNVVSHPVEANPLPLGPYHPYCASPRAPIGSQSAAIFMCQDVLSDQFSVVVNRVTNNQLSSAYGILLVGADELGANRVPRYITVGNNDMTGSLYGCADDLNTRTASRINMWKSNVCGSVSGQPTRY